MGRNPPIPVLRHAFFFLRHGETEANVREIVAGTRDVPLTELGHEQARAAAAALKACGITAIYSSAMRRARDTADYAARELGLPVQVVPELGERNWGVLEGKPRNLRVPGSTPPGAETPESFAHRVLSGLARINEGIPLIVAHAGVFRVLCNTVGVSEPVDPVSNAHPIRCRPPDDSNATWRFEFLAERREGFEPNDAAKG